MTVIECAKGMIHVNILGLIFDTTYVICENSIGNGLLFVTAHVNKIREGGTEM